MTDSEQPYEISSNDALRLASKLPRNVTMTKRDAEVVLDRMVNDQWIQFRNGKYSLTIRSVLELQVKFSDVERKRGGGKK